MPVKGLKRCQLLALGAILLYQIVLLYQHQRQQPVGVGVKALLRAAPFATTSRLNQRVMPSVFCLPTAPLPNTLRPRRHLLSAANYRQEMRKRFASWAEITGTERAA